MHDNRLIAIALTIHCTTCGVQWDWCITKSGRPAVSLHNPRLNPVHEAYALGYFDRDRER